MQVIFAVVREQVSQVSGGAQELLLALNHGVFSGSAAQQVRKAVKAVRAAIVQPQVAFNAGKSRQKASAALGDGEGMALIYCL